MCYVNSYSEVCKQSITLLRLSFGIIIFFGIVNLKFSNSGFICFKANECFEI